MFIMQIRHKEGGDILYLQAKPLGVEIELGITLDRDEATRFDTADEAKETSLDLVTTGTRNLLFEVLEVLPDAERIQ